jgi:5-methyltetrahydropteroyltriglutamate--homocysteine methyltransferase
MIEMSDNRLKTTTIGAFPKPSYTPISDWFPDPDDLDARKAGEGLLKRWQRAGYEQGLAQAGEEAEEKFLAAIEEVVRDQVNAGIDIPTAGEVRRENYIFYQCRHMNGIDFEQLTEKVARQGAFTADVPTITAPVSPRKLVLARDWRIAQRATERPVKITLPGPMTITDSIANSYYPDPRSQGLALAEALNAEVRSLAQAGCQYIQVDEPVFARKPEQALEYGIENLERVFHGVPEHVQRVVHMCCGYPNALDVTEYLKADPKAYFQIATAMDEAAVDAVSIEDAHRHNDLGLLERYSKTTVLLGVIAIAKSRVEEVDEVKSRLEAALQHIDGHRLVAAPDCGLGLLGRDLAIKKLRRLCEGAACVHA